MLASEIPRLATDLLVRVFPGVWKLLSFLRLPSGDGCPSLPLLSLFLSFIFFPTSFRRVVLLFWVPDVLCRHSEVVLWYLLSIQMIFQSICGGRKWSPHPIPLPSSQSDFYIDHLVMFMCSVLLDCWKRVFPMTSAFSWQNAISLCPASFCITRSNLPITPGIS